MEALQAALEKKDEQIEKLLESVETDEAPKPRGRPKKAN